MMTPEDQLKNLIKSRYDSVLQFSKVIGLNESSVRNIFNRGVTSVSLSTSHAICSALNLDLNSLSEGKIVEKEQNPPSSLDRDSKRLLSLYNQLNISGRERLLEYADDLVQSGKYQDGEILRNA